jgi:hypothetical protein
MRSVVAWRRETKTAERTSMPRMSMFFLTETIKQASMFQYEHARLSEPGTKFKSDKFRLVWKHPSIILILIIHMTQ